MFVTAAAQLAVPTGVAQDRLLTLLHADGGLRDAASAAFRAGETVLLRAGFAGVSKQIAVHSVPAYLRGDTTVIPLRWVATGPADQLLPGDGRQPRTGPHARRSLPAHTERELRTAAGTARRPARPTPLHRAARATARGLLTRVSHVILVAHPAPADAPEQPAVDHLGRTDPRWPGLLSLPPPVEPPPTG